MRGHRHWMNGEACSGLLYEYWDFSLHNLIARARGARLGSGSVSYGFKYNITVPGLAISALWQPCQRHGLIASPLILILIARWRCTARRLLKFHSYQRSWWRGWSKRFCSTECVLSLSPVLAFVLSHSPRFQYHYYMYGASYVLWIFVESVIEWNIVFVGLKSS